MNYANDPKRTHIENFPLFSASNLVMTPCGFMFLRVSRTKENKTSIFDSLFTRQKWMGLVIYLILNWLEDTKLLAFWIPRSKRKCCEHLLFLGFDEIGNKNEESSFLKKKTKGNYWCLICRFEFESILNGENVLFVM